ncbi:MAG TPA: PAS domain S-box protein [Desulfobacterales bacterium]|nr:PAS domain S-box protein [Desulfobacterales bacterium]
MIPNRRQRFRLSRPALGIIAASLLLGVLLTTLTIRNIRREESLMRTFLLHEGLTLIRSFEAGARTTMMHRMRGIDPLSTLVTETVKEASVDYIRIVDNQGNIIASSGPWPAAIRPRPAKILSGPAPFTMRLKGRGIFEIAAPFTPLRGWGRGMTGRGDMCGLKAGGRQPQVIYLGLNTTEFDKARKVDFRHALLLGGILFLAGSAGFYLLFLYQDIRVARRTLTDMELYTNNVIESMPAGLITLDTEGRIAACNKQAETITGKSLRRLQGRILRTELPSFPAVVPRDAPLVETPFIYRHQGRAVPVRISTSILYDTDGQRNGLVIIIRDVRELAEIEQKLEQSRRLAALGRMAAGIAHEIRNPLGTIRGFAQLFVNKFKAQAEERQYAEMMVTEVDRLNRTISALLQFSRPREPEFKDVSLNRLLAKTQSFMADDFKTRSIDFHLELPPEEIIIKADRDLLLQILLNLLHNALDAVGNRGRVVLGAARRGQDTALWVTDNGCGLTTEDKERMFDPFFTTKKSGTGLGLAVVHQIISQHGASLEVETAPDRGCSFTIIFPRGAEKSV